MGMSSDRFNQIAGALALLMASVGAIMFVCALGILISVPFRGETGTSAFYQIAIASATGWFGRTLVGWAGAIVNVLLE